MFGDTFTRNETRMDRYKEKAKVAVSYPVEICCINFQCDDNIAFVVRAAACFGARKVNVIGSLPEPKVLRAKSGSTSNMIDIETFSSPRDFLKYVNKNRIKLVAAELCDGAHSLWNYSFPDYCCIVVGHESAGIPVEVLKYSEKVYIL